RPMRVAALVVLAACRAAAPGDGITASALSADIRAIADDRTEGRGTATPGERLAQQYVANRLAADGVAPAAAGSYFQPVHLVLTRAVQASATLAPFTTFVALADGHGAHLDVDAPAVFVGFGISAPEYEHDDLAGVDLHGKIAVVYAGVPASLPLIAQARYADKNAHLASLGAVGTVFVWRDEDEKKAVWSKVAAASAERIYVATPGGPLGSPAGLRALIPIAELRRLAPADALAHPPVELGRIHGVWDTTTEVRDSANVVGVVRGRDPALAGKYVVYTAHLDHLGTNPALPRDPIFNGAIDNGSGVATMLQVARAFARKPAARSALFVATTGEERGLVGAAAFVASPPVPEQAMIADLNIDEVPALLPLRDVVALGIDGSPLAGDVRAAAAARGLAVSPDPEPEQTYFLRGDNVRFAQAGIPALRIEPGELDAAGGLDAGRRAHAAWVRERYHTPKDEWRPDLDFDAMAAFARFAFELGQQIGNAPRGSRRP
ncbi:MAG: M28 family peptidase, partial [Acidobacteriota bacterium]